MCSLETKSVLRRQGVLIIQLRMSVTNASTGCAPQVLFIGAVATVTGPTAGGTAVVAPGNFVLGPRETQGGLITVTLPAGQAAGAYSVSVSLAPAVGTFPFAGRTCVGTIAVLDNFELRELQGNQCTVPGFEAHKKFRLVNRTSQARTIRWTVRSIQNSSSAGVDDHYPIAICPAPLGPGNPLSTVIPTERGTVTIPAGPSEFVDVCVLSRSYGGCHAGSNCCILIEAADIASGEMGFAGSDITAVGADWKGCPVLGRGACDGGLGNQHFVCKLDPLTAEPNVCEHRGVEHLGGLLYVTALGTGGLPPHRIHVIDENSCLVRSFDQIPAAASSAEGFGDGASDGRNLAFGWTGGLALIDPLTGALATSWATINEPAGSAVGSANLPSNPITGPALAILGNYRALAYDPAGNGGAGSFWAANLDSELLEINLAGDVLRSLPSPGWDARGLALDPQCPTEIWVNGAPPRGPIASYDLLSGSLTGTTIERRVAGSIAGGLTGVPGGWAGSGNAFDLIGLDQAEIDRLTAYRVHLYPALNGKEECKLVTTVFSPTSVFSIQRNAKDKSFFNGDALSWGFQAPPSHGGRPAVTLLNLDLGGMVDATRRASTFGIPEFTALSLVSNPYSTNGALVVGDGFGIAALLGQSAPIGPPAIGIGDAPPVLVPPGVFTDGDVLKFQSVYFEPNSPIGLMATNAAYLRCSGDQPPPCSLQGVLVEAIGPDSFNSDPSFGFWRVVSFGGSSPIEELTLSWVGTQNPDRRGTVFDVDQTGMSNAFWEGNHPGSVGACQGTYRNGSDQFTGLIYDDANTYHPMQPGSACSPNAFCGFTGSDAAGEHDYRTLSFRFSNFTAGVFEWDCDTDGGLGSNGSSMAGLLVSIRAGGTVCHGVLQADPGNPNRAFLQF